MTLTVAAWNVAEGLGHTDRSPEIVESIKELDADVVALSDAYWDGNPLHEVNDPDQAETAKESLTKEGYESFAVRYDRPGHFPGRHLLLLSRVSGGFDTVPAADSIAACITVPLEDDMALQVAGVHLDDQSEHVRVEQVKDLASNLETISKPTVLMGDFNAMNGLHYRARLLRSFAGRSAARLSPDLEPRNDFEKTHGRPSKIERLVDMANGQTMKVLFDSLLRDADVRSQATIPDKQPLFALDHIMISPAVAVKSFTRHDKTGLSDHRPISARITVV